MCIRDSTNECHLAKAESWFPLFFHDVNIEISYASLALSPISTRIIHSSLSLLLWNYKQEIDKVASFALNTVFTRVICLFLRTQECYLVDAELWFMFFSHATNLKFCMLVQRCLLHLAESSFKSTIKQSFSLPMVIALSTLTRQREWYCIFSKYCLFILLVFCQ